MKVPFVLVIAGSDSGGGAGNQADIKTITMLGGHAATAITAVTAQNTLGVSRIDTLPGEAVLAQMAAVAEDFRVDAVKIGMIGSAEIAAMVADEIGKAKGRYGVVVLDPVMVATSGSVLADTDTIAAMARLAAIADLITPNLPELVALSGRDSIAPERVEDEARTLAASRGAAVLVKGGHAPGDVITDRLVHPDGRVIRWSGSRIETRHTHGTGCTLASAIATGLGAGLELEPAITRARAYVRQALKAAPGFGAGAGPMGHALGGVPFDLMRD